MGLQFYDGHHFWKSPSEYEPGETLTENTLEEVEKLLGLKLPESYVRYMREQNGGELAYRYVLFDDGDAAIVPFLHEIDIERGVGLSPVFVEACDLPEGIVLITGDLDSWVALDYRKELGEPEVIYLVESANGDGSWEEHLIAPTFELFTKKLFKK